MLKRFGLRIVGLLVGMALTTLVPVYAGGSTEVAAAMQQLARTQDPQDLKNAEIDMEYDAAQCAAYYHLESALAEKSGYGNTDAGKGMAQAADAATQITTLFSNEVGMSGDAVMAQMKMDVGDLVKQLGKNYVNSPLVLQKVGLPCKALLEHPMGRLAHWLKVERKKHTSGAR